jgi:hypothetical protein
MKDEKLKVKNSGVIAAQSHYNGLRAFVNMHKPL